MGYRFNLDAGSGIVHILFSGELSDASMLEAYQAIQAFVADHRVKAGIVDFSGVASFGLTSDFVRFLAHHKPLFPDPIPRVIVAPEDLMYGISRMYQELGSKNRKALYVARSLQEAYELLARDNQENVV